MLWENQSSIKEKLFRVYLFEHNKDPMYLLNTAITSFVAHLIEFHAYL
jgi:hypothetical protein